MEFRVCLKYFVRGCLCKYFFDSNSPQAPSSVACLRIFITLSHLTQFYPEIRANQLEKVLKFVLLDNYFSDRINYVQFWYWLSSLVWDVFFKKDKVNTSQNMTVFKSFTCWYRHEKRKKILKTIMVIIFWELLTFLEMVFLPELKRIIISNNMIISNQPGYTECLKSC